MFKRLNFKWDLKLSDILIDTDNFTQTGKSHYKTKIIIVIIKKSF